MPTPSEPKTYTVVFSQKAQELVRQGYKPQTQDMLLFSIAEYPSFDDYINIQYFLKSSRVSIPPSVQDDDMEILKYFSYYVVYSYIGLKSITFTSTSESILSSNPTLKTQHVIRDIETDEMLKIIAQLNQLPLTLWIGKVIMGKDGSDHEFHSELGFTKIDLKWWSHPPENLKPLHEFAKSLLEPAKQYLAKNPASPATGNI